MSNLDEFFSRYGSPAKEANERVDIYHTRADCIDNIRRAQYNRRAKNEREVKK
jgi:hypothetical protein